MDVQNLQLILSKLAEIQSSLDQMKTMLYVMVGVGGGAGGIAGVIGSIISNKKRSK